MNVIPRDTVVIVSQSVMLLPTVRCEVDPEQGRLPLQSVGDEDHPGEVTGTAGGGGAQLPLPSSGAEGAVTSLARSHHWLRSDPSHKNFRTDNNSV